MPDTVSLKSVKGCERPQAARYEAPGEPGGFRAFTARGAPGGPLRPRGARDRATAGPRAQSPATGRRPAAEPSGDGPRSWAAERPAPGSRRSWARKPRPAVVQAVEQSESKSKSAELGSRPSGAGPLPQVPDVWQIVIGCDNGPNRE